MKTLFFGTPEIAVHFLKSLLNTEEVLAVITQPDKPSSRGQELHAPPVKVAAQEARIPVLQPQKFTPEITRQLVESGADVGVVVSYGRLIPQAVFSAPKFGCFNIHFSLLPKYRGAAPIQRALIDGESITGVSSFWLEKTLDTGPVIARKQIAIEPDDDAVSLMRKLTLLGIEVMKESLSCIKTGRCSGSPQEGEPSFAPTLKKDEGLIHWDKSAREIVNLIRGTKPWPGAYTYLKTPSGSKATLRILKAKEIVAFPETPQCISNPSAGQVTCILKGSGFLVKCGNGFLLVEEVHPENKKQMAAWPFLQGGQLKLGDVLG